MATLRQLTTRFNFETDKRGLNEFREGILGAKSAIASLVGALGIGALGAGLLKAGNNINRAAVLAGQFTDEVQRLDGGAVRLTGELATAWERVQKAIPGRETMTEFLEAFVQFRQSFKDAPLEKFETLFEAAGNLARITGRPLGDMFDQLHQAVVSGDFEALADLLPTLDKSDAAMANFVRRLIEVDPTNVQTVGERLSFITAELEKANPLLRKTADEMVRTTAEGQWDNLINNIRRVGELLSGPVHEAAVELLTPVNAFFDAFIDGEHTIEGFADSYTRTLGAALQRWQNEAVKFFLPGFFPDENTGAGEASGLPNATITPARLSTINAPGFREFERSGSKSLQGGLVPGTVPLIPKEFSKFEPHITVNALGADSPTLVKAIIDALENLMGEASGQFPETEVP